MSLPRLIARAALRLINAFDVLQRIAHTTISAKPSKTTIAGKVSADRFSIFDQIKNTYAYTLTGRLENFNHWLHRVLIRIVPTNGKPPAHHSICIDRTHVMWELVPETGIEPVRPLFTKRRILSPMCLPISPLGLVGGAMTTEAAIVVRQGVNRMCADGSGQTTSPSPARF